MYVAQSVSETPVSDITPPPLFTPVLADDETHPKAECVQTERTVQSAISRLQAEPRSTPTVHGTLIIAMELGVHDFI
jgi:hypothetical protein